MTIPTPDPTKLTGTRRGWWYVVAPAGQRDGVSILHCVCCQHGVERLIPEQKICDRKTNSLNQPCRCKDPAGVFTDRIFGLWTVLGPAGRPAEVAPGGNGPLWECRCACGATKAVAHEDLDSGRSLCCGCRPDIAVFRDRHTRRRQAAGRLKKAGMDGSRTRLDQEWTREMEKALRVHQPRCVNCGAHDDLTTHHVRPVSRGHGLRPGNAVRLCRSCNSSINAREAGELTPEMVRRLQDAAASFQKYWEGGCVAAEVFLATPVDDAPKGPDPALVGLLRAVQGGDDASILALAGWLEDRGDRRAAAIRDVAALEAALGEPVTLGGRPTYEVRVTRHGQPCGPRTFLFPTLPGDVEKSPDQRVRDLLMRRRVEEVRERLGLSSSQWYALVSYLGLSPNRAASTIEETAQRERTQVQTVRNRIRIDLALHNLSDPGAALRLEEQKRRRR